MRKYKLAFLTSHPIQYQVPFFQLLAKRPEIDLTVYFCWNFGIGKKTYDIEFGQAIKWDIPLLTGYKFKFLRNFSLKPSSNFWGQINPGIIGSLTNNKYDAVLIFGWNSFTNWLAFLTAFFRKTPVLLRGENPLNQELLKPAWKRKIKKIILGCLFRYINAFLYIGEENKKFYQYYGVPEEKLYFAPYAVDNKRFMGTRKELEIGNYKLRKKLGIKRDDIVILFVGKLINKKHPFDLIRAFRILNSKFLIHNSFLIFVGDGVLHSKLEKYIKKHYLRNIHFLGFKNQTELPEYYSLSDIFVLPSGMEETWGLAVNEAMCFGLPVIVSNLVGCAADLVKNGENGYIFPTGNIKKLAEYLKKLLKNPVKIKTFGKNSFEIIQSYSFEKDIEGILKALNNL